jgi:hypothetical protein
MTQLDDDVLIRDLSVPGTHDSAAMRGFTHFEVSETQDWRIDDQLNNGIRFLDLRVKRKDGSNELAMWHGVDYIYDPYHPKSRDQLYFRKVIEECVNWIERNPGETIILSVKDEENVFDKWWSSQALSLGMDIYGILTEVNSRHQAPSNPNYHGMWHGHTADCTLGQARGRLILWRRFATPVPDDDAQFPGVDLTELSTRYDNTINAVLADAHGNKRFAAQDYYEGTLKEKAQAWLDLANRAYDSRWDANNPDRGLQFLNFASKAGVSPEYNARVMNPLMKNWLTQMTVRPTGPVRFPTTSNGDPDAWRFRSGHGVVPMDFPDTEIIDLLIRANFSWTYQINAFESGSALWNQLVQLAAKGDT